MFDTEGRAIDSAAKAARSKLVSVSLGQPQKHGDSFILWMTARFSTALLKTRLGSLEVYLSGGQLVIEYVDCQLAEDSINSRFDPKVPTVVSKEVTVKDSSAAKHSATTSAKSSLSLGVSPAAGFEHGDGQATEGSQGQAEQTKFATDHNIVHAQIGVGNLTLSVDAPHPGQMLVGKVMDDDVCRFEDAKPGYHLEVSFQPMPRHIRIGEGTDKFSDLSPTKKHLVERLVAKLIEEDWVLDRIDDTDGSPA